MFFEIDLIILHELSELPSFINKISVIILFLITIAEISLTRVNKDLLSLNTGIIIDKFKIYSFFKNNANKKL